MFCDFEMHKTIAKISFLIVEYVCYGPCQRPEWNLTNYSCCDPILCFKMPPYPMSDASVSTIINASGWGMPKHGNCLLYTSDAADE